MAKTAPITARLMAKKGEAVPATGDALQTTNPTRSEGRSGYYKALTVKLDRDRYEKLKHLGIQLDKKSQTILVEALDEWLQSTTSQED